MMFTHYPDGVETVSSVQVGRPLECLEFGDLSMDPDELHTLSSGPQVIDVTHLVLLTDADLERGRHELLDAHRSPSARPGRSHLK
jgi:hypothetical protein